MSTKITVAIILILLVLGAVGYVRGGQPQTIYVTGSAITALLGDEDGLVWLEGPRPPASEGPGAPDAASEPPASVGASLYALPAGEKIPTCIYSEPRLIDITLAGDAVLAVALDGDLGAVVSIPRAGGEPTRIAEGLARPRSVIEHEGAYYWTETRAAAAQHVTHIPVAGPRVTLMTGGVGVAPAPIAAFECWGDEFAGELIGAHDGRVLCLDRIGEEGSQIGWAAVRSAPIAGGSVETLTTERSSANHAVLDDGVLYYTAPSDDAGAPLNFRAVRRMALADGATETISDFLPPAGRLVRRGGSLYCVAFGGTWALSEKPGPPRREGAYRRGGQFGAEVRGRLYEVMALPDQAAIAALPLTFAGRLIAAVGG